MALAAIARFWGLWFGLPNTNARPDETIIIDVAQSFLRGNFSPKFYDYPWLFMWTLAVVYLGYFAWGRITGAFGSVGELLASWKVRWAPFFLLTRGVSAVAGVLTVVVVFRGARRLWGDATALIAALFMALAFLHVRDSHFGTTDVSMTLLLTWSVMKLMEAHESKRARDFVIAGIIGGLSAATKYNALLLIVPLMASYLLHVFESEDRAAAFRDPRLFQYGLPFLAAFAVGVPFLLFRFADFLAEMHLLRESMQIGSRGLDLSVGWIHHIQYSLRFGLGLPLLIAGLTGVAALALFETRTALLLLSFPVAYFIVAGSVRNLFFRYAIPMLPFLCLAAARLVTRVLRRDAWAFIAAAMIVLPSAISVVQFDRLISRADNRVVIARWFDDHVPEGQTVMMTGSPYGYVQFTRPREFNAWLWDRRRRAFVSEYERAPAAGRPEWILVQQSPLPSETQESAAAMLESGYTLVRSFPAVSTDQWHVYDQQDMYFVPFAGFKGVDRPGPNYTLYKRSGDER